MKRKAVTKMMALMGAAVLMMGTLAGCGGTDSTTQSSSQEAGEMAEIAADTTDTAAETDAAETDASAEADTAADADAQAVSGTITMAGSTSMEKLANAVAESFMEKYPDVTVTAEFTGSSAGVEAVLNGSVDIGNSSRNLKDEEKASGAVENIVAIDGIAVVTDKENTAADLTTEDLISIYTGEIKNWSEVGGSDEAIVVVGREAGSGTRGAFEELLGIEDACAYANELDSTGAVMAKVASTPGAIGYVSLDVLDDTVIALSIDGVDATEENIKGGTYALCRPFVMATNGEISAQSDAVQALFAYLQSDEGKDLIKTVGLIIPD
ncbi:MAG: phosphate ABC transporter substrate-binding protein [Lachnospiraceae bacterium]|nr:phosphate ABC transporter substrate-binding protein [Lachnospiraceae bacterium]